MPRDIGSILAAYLASPQIILFHFLKMQFPSLTLRWTDYSAKVDSVNLSIDGGAEDWDCTKDFTVGQMEQADQTTPLSVSDLSFGNADNSWSERVYNYGWRGVAITVWIGAFDVSTYDLIDSFIIFDGVGDQIDVGDTVRASVLPGTPPFAVMFPRRRFTPAWGFLFMPPPNFKVTWGTVQSQAPLSPYQNPNYLSPNQIYPPVTVVHPQLPGKKVPIDTGDGNPARLGLGNKIPRKKLRT